MLNIKQKIDEKTKQTFAGTILLFS